MIFLNLPAELILQILCELPPSSVTTCKQVNKYLNNLIDDSVVLQYALALHAAKAEDNPCSTLSVASKLKSLSDSEDAWSHLHSDFSTSASVTYHQSGVYDLSAGVYLLSDVSRTLLYAMNLPSKKGDEMKWNNVKADKFIIDLGLCLYEHDLIALVTTAPRPLPLGSPPAFDIEIELREYSTDKPHPLAEKKSLFVMHSAWEKPAIGIEIVGKHLVIILSFVNAARPQDRVFIFDWQKNILKASFEARHRSYAGLLFLTEDLILLPNTNTRTLDIFRIPATVTLESPTPILQLALPPLHQDLEHLSTMVIMSCRAEPNPISPSSYPEMKRRAAARRAAAAAGETNVDGRAGDIYGQRAWLTKSEDAVCLFELRILTPQLFMLPGGAINMQLQFRHRFSFIVHRNALLEVVRKYEQEFKEKAEAEAERAEMEEVERQTAEPDDSLPSGDIPNEAPEHTAALPNPHAPPTPGHPQQQPTSDPAITASWAAWAPPITRWFNLDNFATHWITTSAGQRLVRMPEPAAALGRADPFVVLDFNRERIAKMKRWLEKQPGTVVGKHGGREVLVGVLGRGMGGGEGKGMEEEDFALPPIPYSDHWLTQADEEDDDDDHPDHQEGGGEDEDGGAFGMDMGSYYDIEIPELGYVSEDDGHSWTTAPETNATASGTSQTQTQPVASTSTASSSSTAGPPPSSDLATSSSGPPQATSPSPPIIMFLSPPPGPQPSPEPQQLILPDDGSADWVDTSDGSTMSLDGIYQPDIDFDMYDGFEDGEEYDEFEEDEDMDADDMDDEEENDNGFWAFHNRRHHHAGEATVDWNAPPPGSVWWAPGGEYFTVPGVFAEPLVSGLPYVACVSRGRYRYDGVMLDEERVIGTCSNTTTGRIERIEIHHFG